MTDTERILEKVRRLLALSTSSNVHEAELAAAKAQELLLKYNLEMADVPTENQEGIIREVFSVDNDAGWRSVLMGTVARYNFCNVISLHNKRRALIGQKHNIEVVRYLAEYLEREIDRLCNEQWSVNAYNGFGGLSTAKRWKTSFRFGAVEAIGRTLKAEQDRAKQANVNTMALVLQSDEALRQAVTQYYPQLRQWTVRVPSSPGYGAGVEAGSRINIRQGVGGSGVAHSLIR